MIKEATYTSVWDDGDIAITTPCKVDMETKEVFDIEQSEVSISGILSREYIVIDGEIHDVVNSGYRDSNPGEFWYQ